LNTSALNSAYASYSLDPATESTFLEAVRRHALKRLRQSCPADAEDLAQTVVLHVWQNLKKFNPEKSPFSAWLALQISSIRDINLRAAYKENEVIDRFAHITTGGSVIDVSSLYVADDDTDDERIIYKPLAAHTKRPVVLDAILELPDIDHRVTIGLSYGLSESEISRQTGLSRQNVRTQIKRIRKAAQALKDK
jgi:RNA polymerase sigma factor (sigma-70 family)